MLEIVKYPQRILRQKSRKVKGILRPEIQAFVRELAETMLASDGLGLAANQVNQNIRILAVNTKAGPQVFINPFIYFRSFKREAGEEGCLSFPGVFGLIKRSQRVRLFYCDEKGKIRHLKASGLLARVLQHETDHLNGVLFIDKVVKYIKGEEQVKEWMSQAKADEV